MENNEGMRNHAQDNKKTYIAAGACCFPLAAYIVAFATVWLVFAVIFITSSNIEDASGNIVVLLFYLAAKNGTILFTVANTLISATLIIFQVFFGVRLIRNAGKAGKESELKKSLAFPMVLSILVGIAACYHAAIGLGKIIVHGAAGSNLFEFFVLGLLPLALCVICLIFNRLAAKAHESALSSEPSDKRIF